MIRVQQFLPPSANKILVDEYSSGFRAMFQIEPDKLDQWLDELRPETEFDASSRISGAISQESKKITDMELKYINQYFDGFQSAPGLGFEVIEGPRGANGAGFTLWVDRKNGIAFELAGYW